MAILPSKRIRKAPAQTSSFNEKKKEKNQEKTPLELTEEVKEEKIIEDK